MNTKSIIQKWYSKENPKFEPLSWELLKNIRTHTTDFIGMEGASTRFYTIGNYSFLIKQLHKRFVDNDNPLWHFFRSIEHVRFTDENNNKVDIRDNWEKQRYGFDFVIDIDCEGDSLKERIENAKKETEKVVDFYDELNVPYILNFSGSKGFHIKIPWKELSSRLEPDMYGEITKKMGALVMEKCDLGKSVDTTVWGSRMDLVRVHYTIHPKTGLVVLPLTDKQFEGFSLNLVEPEFLMENMEFYKRGSKKREGSMDKFWELLDEESDVEEYEREKMEEREEYENLKEDILRKYGKLPDRFKKEIQEKVR